MLLLIIDHRVGSRTLALGTINGISILNRFLVFAKSIGCNSVTIETQDKSAITEYIKNSKLTHDINVNIVDEADKEKYNVILNSNEVYDERILRRLIKKKRSNFTKATLWKIQDESDIKKAEDLLIRSKWNPIGKYINVKLGRFLGKLLAKTFVNPNQVTFLMLIVAVVTGFLLASSDYYFRVISAFLIQIFFVLDVVDGQLARLKNMISDFGGWFDAVVDQILLYSLFIGMTIGVQNKYEGNWILLIGIFTISGFSLNFYGQKTADKFFKNLEEEKKTMHTKTNWLKITYRKINGFLESWDVQLYIISLGAILDKLLYVLIYFCLFYNKDWILMLLRKYFKYRAIRY